MSKLSRVMMSVAAGLCLALPVMAEETADAAPAADAGTVLATVNGTEITLGHVAALTGRLPAQFDNVPVDELYDGILEQLIQQTALMQKIEGTLGREAVLSYENSQRAFLATEMINQLNAIPIGEDAIEEAYKARFADHEPEDEVDVRHILVETEDEAKEVIGLLEEGGDFAELAKERSIGPSGPRGGSLDWIVHSDVVAPFGDAVFALEVGAISAPIETSFGWHVIQVNEKRLRAAPPLEELRDELIGELREKTVTEAMDEITDAAEITRAEVEIDPAAIRDVTLWQD